MLMPFPDISCIRCYEKNKAEFNAEGSGDNLGSHYISPCLLRQAHQFLVGLPKRVTEGSTKSAELSV